MNLNSSFKMILESLPWNPTEVFTVNIKQIFRLILTDFIYLCLNIFFIRFNY